MKKILLIVMGLVLALSSCSKLEFDYVPTNEDITFSTSSTTYSLEGQDLVIKLQRGVLDKAITLELTLTDPVGIYTLKTPSVTFGVGENYAEAVVSYDITKLKPAQNYNFTLAFDKTKVAISGSAVHEAKAAMPLEYEDYATMSYVSTGLLGAAMGDGTFIMQRAKYTTTYFRFKGLFNSKNNFDFILDPATGEIEVSGLKIGSLGTGDAFLVYLFATGLKSGSTAIDWYPRVLYTGWTKLNDSGNPSVGDEFWSNSWAGAGSSFLNGGKSFSEYFTVKSLKK